MQVHHMLVTNYDELSVHLGNMLTGMCDFSWYHIKEECFLMIFFFLFCADTTDFVINQLEVTSQAVSLTQVANFAESLDETKIDLERMKTITNGLRVNASQLSDGTLIFKNFSNKILFSISFMK